MEEVQEAMERSDGSSQVLVGVDGSEGNRHALEWALTESRIRGARLIAVYAWHIPVFAYSAPYFVPLPTDEMVEDGQKMLRETLAETGGDPDTADLRVAEGMPYNVLRDLAREPGVDLVVVGSRGRSTAGDLFLGSTSHALSHHCPKPVVIVPTGKHRAPVRPRVGHIVTGTDGSSGADAAVRWAAEEAKRSDSLLEVVTAWTWTAPFFPTGTDLSTPIDQVLKKAADDVLAQTVDRLDLHGLTVKLTAVEGAAADVLVERSEQADMLVVGRRGLGPTLELVLGSVSHSCTHRSNVPVVVVPVP